MICGNAAAEAGKSPERDQVHSGFCGQEINSAACSLCRISMFPRDTHRFPGTPKPAGAMKRRSRKSFACQANRAFSVHSFGMDVKSCDPPLQRKP